MSATTDTFACPRARFGCKGRAARVPSPFRGYVKLRCDDCAAESPPYKVADAHRANVQQARLARTAGRVLAGRSQRRLL